MTTSPGASRIIGTGRDMNSLREVEGLGATAVVQLKEDNSELEAALSSHLDEGIDVVIDYLWGQSAQSILRAAAKSGNGQKPLRFIQVGALGGDNISIPSSILRSTPIELLGSGIGSISLPRLVALTGEMLHAACPGQFKIAFKRVPLSDVGDAWLSDDSKRRTVFTL